ncbi:hypothetical protein C8Q74DRAFT_1297855 [Fomes fomentarius]|nr:hypothetical protein C8Q74DRAFT_1297855 [Fomes fomentarius]
MSPTMHAPRRKTCQALLPDGESPCSASFRGWGKYCVPHLEECAQLSGQYKDAAARAERLRRTGELSDKQVRALANSNISAVDRALERVQSYAAALEDAQRTRAALLRRFPVERDERRETRAKQLEESRVACGTLLAQLQQVREEVVVGAQQRRDRHRPGDSPIQGDSERQPLVARPRPARAESMRWWAVLVVFLVVVLLIAASLVVFILSRIDV